MDGTMERNDRSFWLADVVERDEAGAPTRVRVLEPADDVEGQLWSSRGLGETEDDAKGQGYTWRGLRPAEDDVEGQAWSNRGLGETEDDAKGQAYSYRLRPEEDTKGHVLVIGEGTEAPEGIAGRTFVVEDDVEGQGWSVRG